jgi:hypothetical protein
MWTLTPTIAEPIPQKSKGGHKARRFDAIIYLEARAERMLHPDLKVTSSSTSWPSSPS